MKTFSSFPSLRILAAVAAMCAAGLAQAQGGAVTPATNPYGISALWQQSDVVARSVLVILSIMSAGSWYVIVTKLIEQSKLGRQSRDARTKFWDAGNVNQGAEALKKDSPFRFVAEAAIDATGKHPKLGQHIGLYDWLSVGIERATDRIQASLQDGLPFLAAVSSTAPFVGLFGTVWGIYHALTALGIAGQASIDKVAGPVGEALIMTAIGLAVAVPALLGYNWLARRNKSAIESVRAFGDELHSALLAQSPAR